MKTIILFAAIGLLSALPLKADDVVRTKVVASRGTVSQYEPGTRFVVTESSGPVTYTYGPHVIYKTSSGVVIHEPELRTRIVAGAPVRVHYVTEGDHRVIQRIVIRDRGDKDDDDDDN